MLSARFHLIALPKAVAYTSPRPTDRRWRCAHGLESNAMDGTNMLQCVCVSPSAEPYPSLASDPEEPRLAQDLQSDSGGVRAPRPDDLRPCTACFGPRQWDLDVLRRRGDAVLGRTSDSTASSPGKPCGSGNTHRKQLLIPGLPSCSLNCRVPFCETCIRWRAKRLRCFGKRTSPELFLSVSFCRSGNAANSLAVNPTTL